MLRVQRNDMRKANQGKSGVQKKIRRQAEHPAATAATTRMLRVQRNDMRKLQRLGLRTAPVRIGGCIARQCRRQIKATPKECTTVLD